MSILDYAPVFSLDNAIQIAKQYFNLICDAEPLPSERDQNFLFQTEMGERFVLKFANATEERAMLEAQNQVMSHLAKHLTFCPRVLQTINGEEITSAKSSDGKSHFVRMVTYLPGRPLGSLKRHSDELLYDLGYKIGQLSTALEGFDHPALHRDFHWVLANGPDIFRKHSDLIKDPNIRQTVQKLAGSFVQTTAPLLSSIRQSIVHNDANDFNLIAGGVGDPYNRNQSIIGLIDFGDMVFSYAVGDLAVAIAYTILGKPDPLAAAAQVIKGCHATHPKELTAAYQHTALVYSVMLGVALTAHRYQRPDLANSRMKVLAIHLLA